VAGAGGDAGDHDDAADGGPALSEPDVGRSRALGRANAPGERRTRPRAPVQGATRGGALGALTALLGLAFISPLSLPTYLLAWIALGAVVGALRGLPLLEGAAGTAVIALLVAAYTPLAGRAAESLTRHDGTGAPVDAILVLSGDFGGNGLMRGQSVERLLTGARMARDEGIPWLVVSEMVSFVDGRRWSDSRADQRMFGQLFGVADRMLWVDGTFSTRDEVVKTAALARARGWRRIRLVTSALHTRRACAAAERVGLVVECRPADWRDLERPPLTPGSELSLFRFVAYEWAATALYRVRGWI
jgi:uncharacterized SAM-binding protein YcdF (DUF218 family)